MAERPTSNGCGTTGTSETLTYPAQIITDGTNYQCVPNGGSGGGSGTVNTGASGAATYYASAGTAVSGHPNWSYVSGSLVGNLNASAAPTPAATNYLQLVGADGGTPSLQVYSFLNGGSISPNITLFQSGGTNASKTAVTSAASLGSYNFSGWNGAAYAKSAFISATPTQTYTGSVNGTSLSLNVTANGANATTAAVLVDQNGAVLIPASATNPGANGLYVSGPTSITQGYSVPSALTDGATIAVNAALSNNFTVTIAGNRTLSNPTNLVAGQILNFQITQDATGNRTLAFGANYNGAISLNPAANAVTHVLLLCLVIIVAAMRRWCSGGRYGIELFEWRFARRLRLGAGRQRRRADRGDAHSRHRQLGSHRDQRNPPECR